MAARGVCITMAIINLVSIGGPIADLTEDDCNRESSKNLIYAGIVIYILLAIVYCGGIWVAQSKNSAQAGALFVAHCIASVLNVGVGFCVAGGFSKNVREKDEVFDALCYAICDADPPRGGFGNQDPCEVRNSIAGGVGSLVIGTLVHAYFGYVLWSFSAKCADGTVDNAGNVIVTMAPMAQAAAPMAVGYAPQAAAVAAPVQAQAIPVAQAEPVNNNMYPDLNKPPQVAQAQAI